MLCRRVSTLGFAAVATLIVSTPAIPESQCKAPSSWTSHTKVPAPDTSEPVSNCDFHIWAWNSFLWMTQPINDDALRFETFATVEELFAEDRTLESYAALPLQKSSVMHVRVNKSFEMNELESIFQASSHGALIHGASQESGRAVYYSQNVNAAFYEFVRKNQYYIADTYAQANPETVFPSGAMEFKYSWKIVEDGEETDDFYVAPAEIYLLKEETDPSGKKIVVVDSTKTADVEVALVGVHVVGVVDRHPEFIWATFEHMKNAPNLPEGMSQQSSDAVSDQDWTFYRAGTPAKDANKNNATHIMLIDASDQTLSPTVDVFRAFAWGGGDAENTANIKSLNASVQNGVLAGSVWANYMLVGGVWGQADSLHHGQAVYPQLGSVSLANSTMETFDQQYPMVNCFSCHGPFQDTKSGVTLPALNMNLSHIMVNGYFAQKSKSGN